MKINGEVKYIPSRTVCLKFAGQILPKYVFLCRNRYEVSPYIAKIKICFACYRVGHISKNCRGKPRCIFCEGDAHDSSSPCPQKNNNPCCINCRGEHLATSHDCPLIVRHKLILSLAATENIPLIDARRKILQNTIAPKDINYDFINFPLLNSDRTSSSINNHNHNHNNNYNISNHNLHNLSLNNRYSLLNSLSNSEYASKNTLSGYPPLRGTHSNYNLTHSQIISRSRDKVSPHPYKSPSKQKNFNAHYNLLNSPNGRSPHTTNNGIGYNNSCNSLNLTSNENDNYITNYNISPNNIDIASLNNAIALLSKNIESIYNLVRLVEPLNYDVSSKQHSLPYNNNDRANN